MKKVNKVKNKKSKKININFKDKRILLVTIISISCLLLLISTSLAMLVSSASSSKKDLFSTGDLVVTFDDASGNAINLNPTKPVSDEYGSSLEPYTFKIKNTGSLVATYQVSLTNEVITNPNGLTSSQVKDNIKYQIDNNAPKTLSSASGNIIISGEVNKSGATGSTVEHSLRLWIKESAGNEMQKTTYKAKLSVTGKAIHKYTYKDPSGANAPVLAEGMIPVTYNETSQNWVKADLGSEWYNYNRQIWANAVTVTSTNRTTYMNAPAGTEIPMNDINTMWVWIPRYKYKISTNIGGSSILTSPPEIDVIFETETNTTGVDEETYKTGITSSGLNNYYYTHPAFRDGSQIFNVYDYDLGGWDKELAGIWVGKFETSGNETTPTIKPNLTSLRTQNISASFNTVLKFAGGSMNTNTGVVTFNGNPTYGLTNSTDTHMMKNTEWGAVAILSQSKYGKMGNSDYSGTDKEIYINNSSSMYTGRSGGAPSGSTPVNGTYTSETSTAQYSNYGFYTYDDFLLNYNTNTVTKNVKGKGTGASTTGTIYGIYDMSGGATEYTFGNWNGYSGNSSTYNSGFNGPLYDGTIKTDGISFPESKYYDKYRNGTNNNTPSKEKVILGDATWETGKWYHDLSSFPLTDKPFNSRGGYYNDSFDSGIFCSGNTYGDPYYFASFRGVLIP